MFMGDAEKGVEESREWEDIDILKVAHHGSRTSTTQGFLEQTKPEYSIISVGVRNDYGHPDINILNRLLEANSVVYRTDLDGTVILISNGENYRFEFDKRILN